MPIICVCNDKYKQSMRSLRNHCIELDWRKPTKQQVAGRLQVIARAEGLSINTVRVPSLYVLALSQQILVTHLVPGSLIFNLAGSY